MIEVRIGCFHCIRFICWTFETKSSLSKYVRDVGLFMPRFKCRPDHSVNLCGCQDPCNPSRGLRRHCSELIHNWTDLRALLTVGNVHTYRQNKIYLVGFVLWRHSFSCSKHRKVGMPFRVLTESSNIKWKSYSKHKIGRADHQQLDENEPRFGRVGANNFRLLHT